MPDQAEVDAYLPAFEPQQKLDIANPISMGTVGVPEIYTEARKACMDALDNSYEVIKEHWEGFAKQFGRSYKPIETYKAEDAETLLVTMGSIGETAMMAVDQMREAGQKVGLVRIRLWRPFPSDDFMEAIKGAKALAVVDRALQPGSDSGPVGTELKALLHSRGKDTYVANFVAGLSGRDVTRADFRMMAEKAAQGQASGATMTCEMVGVKE
jgi:pyruvate ferredoxin oxidoreductase alpha subunit